MLPEIMHSSVEHNVSGSGGSSCVFPSLSGIKYLTPLSTGCYVSSKAERYDYNMRIILLGDQGVGKTSFMKAIKVHPDFLKIQSTGYSSHASDHLELEVTTSTGRKALVRICDTGGQERYRSLTSSYYRGAHGVLLMFNVCNAKSLENIELWLSDLDTFSSSSSCARFLVGTNSTSTQRTVEYSKAKKYAESRELPYMEIDSSQFCNVIEGLKQIVEYVIRDITSFSSTGTTIIRPSSISDSTQSTKCLCLC